MISKFLRAKHWQLFLLQFILPAVMQIMIMALFMLNSNPNSFERRFTLLGFLFPILIWIYVYFFFGWLWSIGVGINDQIGEELRLNVNRFKTFLLIPALYFALISLAFGAFFLKGPFYLHFLQDYSLLIVMVHLFSMFCMFYCLNFAAKTFKTAELKRSVTFGDYAGEFFLFWFFIIGVWILQPKINELADPTLRAENDLLDDEF